MLPNYLEFISFLVLYQSVFPFIFVQFNIIKLEFFDNLIGNALLLF